MSDPTTENGGNGDLMAGEYVLGVLNAERHAEAQARIARDRAFAAQVAAWEDRLTPLTEDVAPVAVPSHVWRRIEVALFGPEPQKRGLWDSLPFWRWLGAGASATAAALVAVVLTMSPPQTGPSLVAALQASSSGPSYVVKVDGASGNLVIRPVAASPDASRVPELWLIPADGVPRSLGLIREAAETTIEIPQDLASLAGPDASLAISLEPQGGSPTGQPTGPVIAAGKLQKI